MWKRTRGSKRSGPHVYLTATKTWYRLKRFSGTKCHNMNVWFHLKRFLGTVCDENGLRCELQSRKHVVCLDLVNDAAHDLEDAAVVAIIRRRDEIHPALTQKLLRNHLFLRLVRIVHGD